MGTYACGDQSTPGDLSPEDVYRAIQGADLQTARREVDKIINSTDPADKD